MFKGSYLFQTIILAIHVSFRGCTSWLWLPLRFNISSKTNWCLEDEISFWDGPVSGDMLVFGGVLVIASPIAGSLFSVHIGERHWRLLQVNIPSHSRQGWVLHPRWWSPKFLPSICTLLRCLKMFSVHLDTHIFLAKTPGVMSLPPLTSLSLS